MVKVKNVRPTVKGVVLKNKDTKKLYKQMLLARRFEEKAVQLYGMGYIAGFCHLYIGQEALAVGLNHIKDPKDTSVTSYRCHVHALINGELDPKVIMAELTGKAAGSSKGKGGSMHIFSPKKGFYGGHGIVGAQVPLATGMALAHKYKNDGGIATVYLGDGAASQGQVAEAFNMGSLWKLPVVYIIENNQYAMGTSVERNSANTDFSLRGLPYSIPSLKVDGMDILDVLEKGQKAFDHVRGGNGPLLLDVWTYRYRGHSMSDPDAYRTREEKDNIRDNRDPITAFMKYATKASLLSEDEMKTIQKEIKNTMKEVEEFAINAPEPELSELYTDVFAQN